tara:strand:+ start:2575 stop:2802 length:228 start_codon:yes stop_codon:yes gene_type:complete
LGLDSKNKIFLMVREKSSSLMRNYDTASFLVKGGQDFYWIDVSIRKGVVKRGMIEVSKYEVFFCFIYLPKTDLSS